MTKRRHRHSTLYLGICNNKETLFVEEKGLLKFPIVKYGIFLRRHAFVVAFKATQHTYSAECTVVFFFGPTYHTDLNRFVSIYIFVVGNPRRHPPAIDRI